ncbi:ChuX/HutX family heme-like substrate-binding protein [Candidatus Nitrosacidococcus tergens]|uniref:Hemin-degrading family protein n=1 Tax=Candidatus Nitrosacidococcus tergens TaxID=553981 RepID=A0A7G1Q9C1_9GAMM|nr:ChuX/HutX family heme-like substrate-binding protein [Candidatus Nitrosacidococcus tergens]CAB1275329.1 Hemin-degrading family protein [Candidatus Nitrosacidococcus tergens]
MLTLTTPTHLQKNSKINNIEPSIQKHISEVELLAEKCGGTATRLSGLKDLIQELPKLGKVRAVISNPYAIQGQTIQYKETKLWDNQGSIQGSNTCLCLLLNHWHYGFAIQDWDSNGKFSYSLQFFDRDGVGVYKIHLTTKSNQYTYKSLVIRHRSSDQTPRQSISPLPRKIHPHQDEITSPQLQQCWQELQDLQDLPSIFHYFGVDQLKGLQIAGTDFAVPITVYGLQYLLNLLQETKLPVVFRTYNQGAVQTYQGEVQYCAATGGCVTILDTYFSLRMRSLKETKLWIIRKFKGSNEMAVISLYDRYGTPVFQISSQNGYGRTAKKIWQQLLTTLEKKV